MKQDIVFNPGAIQKLGAALGKLSAKRIFLVTGNRSYTLSGAEKKTREVLAACEVKRFAVSAFLPDLHEVERGLKIFREDGFNLILAIGGGAVLDIAKLIGIFSAQAAPPQELIAQNHSLIQRKIPLLAIPTTAGSGAEATHFAVLYVGKTKHSVAHPSIRPDMALVDPDLSLSLSPRLAAAAGLDALSQGIESFWSVNATEQSKKYSREAIKLAYQSLMPAVQYRDYTACIQLSHAALLAGQAINISKTTAPHAVSYTLTANFNVPHGHAVFLTLGEFLAHNANVTDANARHPLGASHVRATIQEICELLGSSDARTARSNLQALASSLGLETNLSSLGISHNDLDLIAKNINLERLANHPRKLTIKTIRSIVERIA